MKKLVFFISILIPMVFLQGSQITWSTTPTTLSTSDQNASDPQIAIDNQGNVVVAWIENGVVKSSGQNSNENWGETVSTLSDSGASSLQLMMDSNGNATALWVENGAILSIAKPYQGSWGERTTISNAGIASLPQLTVDASGNLVAVWVLDNQIQSATKLLNGNWQATPDILSTADATTPQVSIGAQGTVVAVWSALTDGVYTIYSANKLLTGNWSSAQSISDSTYNCIYPLVGVDQYGNTSSAWIQYQGSDIYQSELSIQSASLPLNGSWSLTQIVSGGLCNLINPFGKFLFDGSGNAVAVWGISSDGYSFDIQAAMKFVGQDWKNQSVLSLGLYSFAADAAMTTLGNLYVIYMCLDSDGVSFIIQVTECDINSLRQGYWTVPNSISQGTNNGFPCLAAVNINGTTNVIAGAWLQVNSSGITTIQAISGTQEVVQPPSNLIVTQNSNNFLIYNEYYNTLSWESSASANIQQYNIYRNGFLIGSLAPSAVQYIDHNRIQGTPVTYGIVAVDGDNMPSVMTTLSFP